MYRIPLFALAVALAAGCSKSDTAQARSREGASKAVRVEAVRQESVKRAVDVVGTLTPVDQVTISSEADGTVSRVIADLGDRGFVGGRIDGGPVGSPGVDELRVDRRVQRGDLGSRITGDPGAQLAGFDDRHLHARFSPGSLYHQRPDQHDPRSDSR